MYLKKMQIQLRICYFILKNWDSVFLPIVGLRWKTVLYYWKVGGIVYVVFMVIYISYYIRSQSISQLSP